MTDFNHSSPIEQIRTVIAELRNTGVAEIALITEWISPDINTPENVDR